MVTWTWFSRWLARLFTLSTMVRKIPSTRMDRATVLIEAMLIREFRLREVKVSLM